MALCVACVFPAAAAAAKQSAKRSHTTSEARYYVQARNVKIQTKQACGRAESLGRTLLVRRLEHAPQVVTHLSDKPLTGDALAKALAARRLQGYAVDLRIVGCTHQLSPPPPGKAFKVLSVEVSAALDAEKVPSGQIARAGDGTAQVSTEVRRIKPKELDQLRAEALEAAIGQAVDKFVKSLQQHRPAKRKKRRRRKRR